MAVAADGRADPRRRRALERQQGELADRARGLGCALLVDAAGALPPPSASGRNASRATRASSACARSRRRGPGSRAARRSSSRDTSRDMAEAPSGTVTLVFGDIEGSTRLLQRSGDAYAELLSTHRDLIREAFRRHNGFEVDMLADSFFATFASAKDAAAAAVDAQRALAGHEWPDGHEIRVRMGLHTGRATPDRRSLRRARRPPRRARDGGRARRTGARLGVDAGAARRRGSGSATSASTGSRTSRARSTSTSSRSRACPASSRR